MKVVISTYTFLPDIGGVASVVANLAAAFHQLGHDTTVVTLTPGAVDGFPYKVVRQPSPLRLVREYAKADLLVLSNLSIKLAYPLVFMRRKYALQHHSESAFHLSDKPWSADQLRRRVVRRATHFMTSAYVGRKSPYTPYVVTPPFASLDQFTAEIKQPLATRSDAVFVGRIEPEKGVEWLLQRWPDFRQMLEVDRLHVVGDGSILNLLRERYARLPQVVFHGAQSRQNTARILGTCRYAFVPSLWAEPFGAVALEALAAEAIPIVSDRGGLPEAVPGFGHYFDPDNDASVMSALRAAKEDYQRQSASADLRSDWQQRTQQHLAKFEPVHVAERIIQQMCT